MKKGSAHDNVRAIIALLIMLLSFSIFLLFYLNSYTIFAENNFYFFMVLATIGMGLMIGLMYLVNNSHAPHKSVAPSKKVQKAKPVKTKAKAAKKKK